jgi:succinylglutamate desuccinylase
MKQQLQQSGDFLSITREHEWHLDAFSFTLDNGTNVQVWDTGVICFEPSTPGGKDIVLSSAVHGNETAPIEICDSLIKNIITQQLVLGHRVLFIFGNPASINFGDRFVEENLNRLFSGAHSDGPGLINKERKRAKVLETYVERFFTSVEAGRYRCHYDLHTAIRGSKNEKFAVYPFLNGGKWQKAQFELLLACGVNTFLLMTKPATTFSYFSSDSFGADSFTVELGKVRPFGENDMSKFAGTKNTLTALISGVDLPTKPFKSEDFCFYDVYRMVDRLTEDFSLNFSDDAENFTDFPIGYVLAEDGGKQHIVDTKGEAIIFPNAKVAIGQRALLTVIPLDIEGQVE